jgi:ANTAR domain
VLNRDTWLAATLVELADAADAECGEAACAELLAASVAALVAPAEVGLVLAGPSGGMAVAAASTRRVRDVVRIEEAHRQGPGTDSGALGERLFNERLGSASARWPEFALAARSAGFAVVSAFPMRRRAQAVGAIIVLGAGSLLDVADADQIQVIARAAAIAIAQQREFRQSLLAATQLQHALDSRVIIEQAKGAVAARLGITPEAAFVLLRAYARSEGRPLARVAEQTISGELALGDLVAPRRGRQRQRVSADQSR